MVGGNATGGGKGGGVFVGANWKGRLLRSEDAVEWREVFKSDRHIEAVCFGG